MTADEIKRLREKRERAREIVRKWDQEARTDSIVALLDAAEEAASLRAERDQLRAALEEIGEMARAALAVKKDGGA